MLTPAARQALLAATRRPFRSAEVGGHGVVLQELGKTVRARDLVERLESAAGLAARVRDLAAEGGGS